MRAVGVATTSRADYGILRPVLRAIDADPELDLVLFVTGSHLSEDFGMTVEGIERDGLPVAHRIEIPIADDSPTGAARAMGSATTGVAEAIAAEPPDLFVVLGDRFEMHACAVATLPFAIPLAHIHGGETTAGAIDDAIRHSLTKLSHLHFPSTEAYGRRIAEMGEEDWRITVSGAPALDNLAEVTIPERDALAADLSFDPDRPFILVTHHPVTLGAGSERERVEALLGALEGRPEQIVFTHPNADPGRAEIVELIEDFARDRDDARVVVSAGVETYFGLMRHAAAMVGNSSSGIIEAASFELPVVNIGMRQDGRLRPPNVIDADDDEETIADAVERATSSDFRDGLRGMDNPYGDGHAAERIVERLKTVELGRELLVKRPPSPADGPSEAGPSR